MPGTKWITGDIITFGRMNQKTLIVQAAEPAVMYAGMLWLDTDDDILYQRKNANDGWYTVAKEELAHTITGLWTFNRGAAVPFAVDAASLKVTNLDADLVDGAHAGNAANKVPILDAGALLPLAQIPATLTGKDADTVDTQHRVLTINADHTHQSTGAQGGKIDHGLALDGLGDDDHTIYQLVTAARAFTGDLLPDATNTRKLGNSTGPKRWSEIHGTNIYGSVRYADMRFLDLMCINCGKKFRVGDSLKLVVKGFEEDKVTGLEMLAVPVHMRCRRLRKAVA